MLQENDHQMVSVFIAKTMLFLMCIYTNMLDFPICFFLEQYVETIEAQGIGGID